MKKTIIALFILVVVLGAVAFALFTMKAKAVIVFEADPGVAPYQITWSGGIYLCEQRSCELELEVGRYDFYLEKDGYYTSSMTIQLDKREREVIDVEFEIVPGLRIDPAANVDEAIFGTCYGDIADCDIDDLYEMRKDDDTGYIALWEGITRRATFTKGMSETKVFVGELGAVVWDEVSGDAYLVNFLEDTRSFLFEVEELDAVMFIDEELIVEAGEKSYWWLGGELIELEIGGGLDALTYVDGKIYFLGDGYVGSYDGFEYYTLLDGVDIDMSDAVIASDDSGIYVKSGGEVFAVRW